MTGYLTGTRDDSGNYSLWIPDKEVQEIYEDDIIEWFKGSVKKDRDSADKFYNAAFDEDPVTMTRVLNRLLRKSVSVRDSFARKSIRENFYHGFILGLLTGYEGVDSNSENGDGYSDITITDDNRNTVIVFELKYSESGDSDSMKKSCMDALGQIESKHYDENLVLSGMYDKVVKYGLAFNMKRAMVMMNGAN
ncbi:MAG: PD-(D/E)XK nuclease domain-containing protein [Catonella sp.]|nr:PD-(D/E)XK nuclease domain-containing protein [Catonella sp.]MDY6356611.1 PD-(D/E)XK nuclease domain-containing protein [Catonella sp.]